MTHKITPGISFAQMVQSKEKKAAPSYASVAGAFKTLSLSAATKAADLSFKVVEVIPNVHEDDVHVLSKISEETFISGSKDGALKKWNLLGEHIHTPFSLQEIDYTKWITAAAVTQDKMILAGTRDGFVGCWTEAGEFMSELVEPSHRHQHVSTKQRNWDRINCMTLSEHGSNDVLFVGRPAHFSVINKTTARPIAEITTHRQDWVYCIHPLSERSFAVVTGTELEAWGCDDTLSQWKKTAVLVSDTLGATSPGHVRPFISSVTALEGQSHLLGLSLFNSGIEGQTSVKIYDTKSENTIFESPGHQGRAWEIENLARDVFASCGDEGTIKIWDMRQKKVTFTLKDNTKEKSRVSCLVKMGDHTLVSASCPDEVRKTADKARFCIRDMRKFTGGTL